MSYARGDPYRSSASALDVDGGRGGGGPTTSWDTDRFHRERERVETGGRRFVDDRDSLEGPPLRDRDRLGPPDRGSVRRQRSLDDRLSGPRERYVEDDTLSTTTSRGDRFEDDRISIGPGGHFREDRIRATPRRYEEDHISSGRGRFEEERISDALGGGNGGARSRRFEEEEIISPPPRRFEDDRRSTGPPRRVEEDRASFAPRRVEDDRPPRELRRPPDDRRSNGPPRQFEEDRISVGPRRFEEDRISVGPRRFEEERISSGPRRVEEDRISSGPRRVEEDRISSAGRRPVDRAEQDFIRTGVGRFEGERIPSGPAPRRFEDDRRSSAPRRFDPDPPSPGPGPRRFEEERISSGPRRFEDDRIRRGPGRFEETRLVDRTGGPPPRDFDENPRTPRSKRASRFHEDDLEIDEFSPPRHTGSSPIQRRKSIVLEKDFVPPPPVDRERELVAKPKFVRRQSSLDTFDRRSRPKYGDRETIPIKAPPRRRIDLSPDRLRSPPRRYDEREYEQIRIAEPDFYGDELYHGWEERGPRRRPRARSTSQFGYRSSNESINGDGMGEKPYPRRGKTRMPKRLVERSAIIALQYPYEEEPDHLVIKRALAKEHIDELVRISREIRESGTTTLIEESKLLEAPPSASRDDRVTEIVLSAPPPQSLDVISKHAGSSSGRRDSSPSGNLTVKDERRSSHRKSSPSGRSHSHRRSKSSHGHGHSREKSKTQIVEDIEQSDPIHGPLTVLASPQDRRKDDRTIKAEIKELERERRALRHDRDSDRDDRSTYESNERSDREKDDIKVERDRRGKMSLVR